VVCFSLPAIVVQAAETAYISDNLTVPLRSGPSTANRILHRGLPSGTALEILSRDADSGFVQIRTSRGTEGWLPEQYLVKQPIARDQLVSSNAKVRELTESLGQLREELRAVNSSKGEADTSNSSLRRQVSSLQQELAEIKKISASAIKQNETNKELNALNQRLRTEVDDLVGTISQQDDNLQERWLLIGGGLVLLGLILGASIKARPRRSAWN